MTLTIRDLQVAYDDVPAVRGVSLTVPDGQVLAVLGPSGCGKSTLLRGVAGLEQASGEVAWDGEDVSRLPTHRRGFALMFQDGQLFDHLTVARNVGYALRLRRAGRAIWAISPHRLNNVNHCTGFRQLVNIIPGDSCRIATTIKPLVDPPNDRLRHRSRQPLAGM